MTNSLNHKRILITEINFENELQMEILRSLVAEEAIVLVFLTEFAHYDKLASKFPRAHPLLVDINKEGGERQATKLLSVIPPLAHILNTTGEIFNKSLSKAGIAYNYKVEEIGYHLSAKDIIKKLTDSGNTNIMLNLLAENHAKNISAAIKERVTATFNESRQSFRRILSLGSSTSASSNNKPVSATLSAPAATSLPQNQYKSKIVVEHMQPTKYKESQNKKIQEENDKVIKVLNKLAEKSHKKYREMEKNLEKKQLSREKELRKTITLDMKKEKAQLMRVNEQANSETMSRSGALSTETANRIVASRAARVDKEVDRNAEKKFRQGHEKVITEMSEVKKLMIEKHCNYVIEKQIKKFQELQQNLRKL